MLSKERGRTARVVLDHPGHLLVATVPFYDAPGVMVALLPEDWTPSFTDSPPVSMESPYRKVYIEADYVMRRRATGSTARLFVYAHCPADMHAFMEFCRSGDAS